MQFDIANEFFLSFITSMNNRNVRYMLIGGWAVNFHGYIRNTQDLDVWLAPTNENRDLFFGVFLDIGYTEDEIAEYRNEDFTIPFKCSIGELPGSIDCLTYVHPNLSFDEAEKQMIQQKIDGGVVINVVNYDYLRQMKILTHRPQDWADVAKLDEIKREGK